MKGNVHPSGGELTREKMQVQIKKMSRKIALLKKKSRKSKRAQDITPTKLTFTEKMAERRVTTPKRRLIRGKRTSYTHRLLVCVYLIIWERNLLGKTCDIGLIIRLSTKTS